MAKKDSFTQALPSNVREIVAEIIEKGPMDLGSGFHLDVIAGEVSHKCKCKCTISGLISGPDSIVAGGFANYTFKAGAIGTNGDICEECKHIGTDWGTNDPKNFPPLNPTATSCQIKVPKGTAANTQISLTATPKGECKCKTNGTTNPVTCTPSPDSITITTK